MIVKTLQFTDAGRTRFIEFLKDAYGADYFERRVDVEACISECIPILEERATTDESLSWELEMTHRGRLEHAEFRCDLSDFHVTETDNGED